MTVPLIILAIFAGVLGFVGTPLWPWFQAYLMGQHESATGWGVLLLMLVATGVVLVGIGLAGLLYGLVSPDTAEEEDVLERWQPSVFAVLRDKFYLDELYEATVIRLNAGFSRFAHWLDAMVLDTLVTAVSYLVLGVSWVTRVIDEYVINLGFNKSCERVRAGGGFFSKLQNGQVQDYLRVIAVALTVFLLLLTWGCSQ